MAHTSKAFIEQGIDRTHYGACYTLALLIFLLGSLGLFLLWRASGITKHEWHLYQAPKVQVTVPTGIVDQVKQRLENKAKDAASQAGDTLENKAKEVVNDQIDQQTNQLKERLNNP